jgi:hypothetical protein
VPPALTRWLQSHGELPRILRVWFVVPATVLLVIVGGLAFTLPPGPLCDEGMVLFMEGGCDWGASNEFFFAKLGLLLAMNLVFILAWCRHVTDWRAFLPHFAVLALLTAANYSDEYCRHYYTHPNGSIGQMTAEAIAFGALGVTVLTRVTVRNAIRAALALVTWNAFHIGTFYLGLLFADHWTWLHTSWIVAVLGATAAAVTRYMSCESPGFRVQRSCNS